MMRLRVAAMLFVATAVMAANLVLPARATVTTTPCQSDRSYEAGTTELCGGTLVYRDFVYDDHGADTKSGGSGVGGKAIGDVAYAEHGADENVGDLLDLRTSIVGSQLVVEAHLNTLFDPASTVVAVAIDTDRLTGGGGGEWPGFGVRSDGWDELFVLRDGDPESNVLTGRFPVPSGRHWRVQAVTALADGTITNVAFRSDERGEWFDGEQAKVLATGDISTFGADVDARDLRSGRTRGHAPRKGLRERVYVSDHPMGEGISLAGRPGRPANTGGLFAQSFNFFGTHQPYVIYVPEGEGPLGLQLMLHGAGSSMGAIVTSSSAGFVRTFGDGLGRVVVAPLGRGLTSLYADEAERDVLDVLDDVHARYDIDPDEVVAGGYSMGGYGTLRLVTHHPDRFAGYLAWVPGTGDCLNGTPLATGDQRGALTPLGHPAGQRCDNTGSVGNVFDLLGNTRHIPGGLLFAGADELVWANHAVALTRRLGELAYPHQVWTHPAAEHFTFAVLDNWNKEAAWSSGMQRVTDPGHLTYRVDQALERPDLGITYRGTHWLSGLASRRTGYVGADIVGGCGTAEKTTTLRQGAGALPLPWVSQRADVTGSAVPIAGNQLTGSLENVSQITVDSARACVAGATVNLTGLATDGPVTIRFSDGAVRTLG